jgi:hypothetical protein
VHPTREPGEAFEGESTKQRQMRRRFRYHGRV